MSLQSALLPVTQQSTEMLAPSPAGDLTNTDIQRIQASLDHSVSANTRAMYASAWRAFQAWTHARGTLSMPASPPLVAAYLAYLAGERRLSVATTRLHKAAQAAGLGEDFTGHSGRVGMAQDLVKNGVELPALMTAGRCRKSSNE